MGLSPAAVIVSLAAFPHVLMAFEGASAEPLQAGSGLLEDLADAMGETGGSYLHAAKIGLPKIEAGLAPILPTVPRDARGRLEGPAVRYALYHFFVREYGWRINGLDPMGEAWNSSSPSEVAALKRMPESVRELLARRLNEDGLDERGLAVLAWTLRFLIQDETDARLRSAYGLLRLPFDTPVPPEKVELALDLHMASHVASMDLATTPQERMMAVYARMSEIYPEWNKTADFIHGAVVAEPVSADGVSFAESRHILSNITERYGLWQDGECRNMKAMLLPWEDQGSGRVHLTDFYRASLGGKWQFSESADYLRSLGALDESTPSSPRVIIVNYLLSYSNCVASTAYNDLCCLSECEALMAQIERQVGAAAETPERLMQLVEALPSPTVPAGRRLDPVLQQRLWSVAAQHDGGVPIYGRLFAQWMHHAYPRECPYPHVAGTTHQAPGEYLKVKTSAQRIATAAEMLGVVALPERKDHPQETVPWDPREEVFAPPPTPAPIGFAVVHLGATGLAMCIFLAGLLRVSVRGRPAVKAAAPSPQIPV